MKCLFFLRREVIFAVCVPGAILCKRVNASASCSPGRRSTLQCSVSHVRGKRNILRLGESALSMNCSVRAAQT